MTTNDPVEPAFSGGTSGRISDQKAQARLSLEQGNYDAALSLFNRVLAVNPADPEALNGKGLALLGLGRDDEARRVHALIQQIQHAPGTGSGPGPSLSKYSPSPPGSSYAPAKYNHREQKNPVVAALCSMVIPGLGQVYNGETGKGIIVFALTLMGLVFLILPGVMVWLLSIHNASAVAGKMNSGEYTSRSSSFRSMALFAGAAIIMMIIAIVAGLYLLSVLLSF
jgi:TM2 domain-containing membrane protein YozV